MQPISDRPDSATNRFAPEGSSKRKFIQIIGVLLLLEGLATILLSSKFDPVWGIPPVVAGVIILILFPPMRTTSDQVAPVSSETRVPDTYGIKLVDAVMNTINNDYIVMALGAAIIGFVALFNGFISDRPEYGDLDTLTFVLGAVLLIYPFAAKKYKVEIVFALLFISFVVIILVIPQAYMSLGSDSGSHAANWYVHYLLAAPFAGSLNLLGIHASSFEEYVTITFHDGTVNTLGISTACAGLYSFSIFVAAFLAFTLVFERLPPGVMALVLGIGVFAAYLGNLLRMIIIGVIGYYNGMDALLWAHKNVGWMIFLGWSALFWYLVIRYADKKTRASSESRTSGAE